MKPVDANAHFAHEMQGLQRLKSAAAKDPSQGLKQASQQFEALFLQQMLKSMRAAIPKSELMDSSTTDFYTDMLDAQLAQNMAGKGLGFAEKIERHLRATGMVPGHEDPATLIAGIPRAQPKRLQGELNDLARQVDVAGANPISAQDRGNVSNPFDYARRTERAPHVQAFLNQMTGPANKASVASGVPADLILAQAALETGWGKERIKTASGGNSHNVFGIKAGASWKGEITDITTTEYVDGKPKKSVQSFRVYPSYEAAFSDYASLISSAPRYQGVVNAPDAKAAAQALQRGGYATDPEYANKLIAVMNSVGEQRMSVSFISDDATPFGSKIW